MSKKHQDCSCPSIVKIWVSLENAQDLIKFNADTSQVKDLSDFKDILKTKYEELKNANPQNIIFLKDKEHLLPDTDLESLAKKTCINPLFVRYMVSNSSSK